MDTNDEEKSPLIDADDVTTLPSVVVRTKNASHPYQTEQSSPTTTYQSNMGLTDGGGALNRNNEAQLLMENFMADSDDDDEDDPLSHCHVKKQNNSDNSKARKTLILASILCLLFMLGEIVGGYIAGSLAIMTDAAHLLTDFASFLISLFSLFVASRPATRRMSFGWHRAEVLGAFISVLLIWIITGVLVYIAIERIINKSYDIDAGVMLITAAVGVAVNIVMGVLLHGGGHGHSHGGGGGHSHGGGGGHSHNGKQKNGKVNRSSSSASSSPDSDSDVGSQSGNGQNINVRAAFIHVIGDFFQSLGVLIAAYIIYYHPELAIMDPICTFIFSILVLITTLAIMKDALNVLMEGSPKGIDFLAVADSLGNLKGVQRVHNLRIWSLTLDKIALSVHLAVVEGVDSQEVLKSATKLLRKQYGVFECTIQIESYSNDMEDCTGCEHPKE